MGGNISCVSILSSVLLELTPIFPMKYKIINYVLLPVGILLITGIIMYFFKKEDTEEDNAKDKKAVTLYLSGKSSELISDMDDSTVDTMIQLFADKENAETIAKQFESLDPAVEINQQVLAFCNDIAKKEK